MLKIIFWTIITIYSPTLINKNPIAVRQLISSNLIMFFKRIGAKKHKYQLELTLSTIKYCPWNCPCIKILFIRGNHKAQSPCYDLYKGRCNLDNYQISLPCTMFFDDGKYLEKEAEIKIKAYNKQKQQLGDTLSKIVFDLVQYTDEDRLYEEQFDFEGAKLSCSIYMKLVDDNVMTDDTNTQQSHLSHLSFKTEKIGKDREGKNRSTSKQRRNTLNFGKSNKLITEPGEEENPAKKEKDTKRGKREDSQVKTTYDREKDKRRKPSEDVNEFKNRQQKQVEVSTAETKRRDKQKEKQKEKDKVKQKVRDKDKTKDKNKQKDNDKFEDITTPEDFSGIDYKKPNEVPSPHTTLFQQTPFKNSKQKSHAQQFIYQKQLEQKTQLMQKLQQQNERLKNLLQQHVISNPIQTKQSAGKVSRLEQQNQKLRQKIVQKEIQLSEYQLKFKVGMEKESKLISEKKASEAETRLLREQLETVKNKVVEALTDALESGNIELINFIEDHFSFE